MEFKMTDKTYNLLKWIAQIVLPALGTLWTGVAIAWHIGYIEEVLATITAVELFLGTILGISTANYNARKNAEK